MLKFKFKCGALENDSDFVIWKCLFFKSLFIKMFIATNDPTGKIYF